MENLPRIDLIRTGQRLNMFRMNAGYSVSQLQEVFNFSTPNAIYKWQSGKNLPTIDNLIILSQLYGKTIEELLVIES